MEIKLSKNIEQYIDLVYSEKSDLNQVQDLQERKKQACAKAKLDFNSESTQNIVHMKDKDVNTRIYDYLVKNNSNDFILLVSNQHLFWEMQQRLIEPLSKHDTDTDLKDLELKTKISEKSETLLERINQRYKAIFKGEEESEMAGQKIRLMRPEERLKQQKTA